MVSITKAAFDAAVAQARKEGEAWGRDQVAKLEARVDEIEAAARAQAAQFADTMDRATDPLQGGKWRKYKPWVYGALAIAALLAAVVVLSGRAQATESCTPVVVYPPDIEVKCMSGQLVVDSDLMPMAIPIGYPCRGYS